MRVFCLEVHFSKIGGPGLLFGACTSSNVMLLLLFALISLGIFSNLLFGCSSICNNLVLFCEVFFEKQLLSGC